METVSPGLLPYPGDAAMAAFVKTHSCPRSFHAVRFRFWGLIPSLAFQVSPLQAIETLWNGATPEFDDTQDASNFYGQMLSLWNHLAKMNMAGQSLRLSPREGLDASAGLKAMLKRRLEELEDGFADGFVGDMTLVETDVLFDSRAGKPFDRLGELIEYFSGLLDALEAAPDQYTELRCEFIRLDNTAQRRLDAVVKAANAERRGNASGAALH